MYYTILNNRVYQYADYMYEGDCLETQLCTMKEYIENPDKFIIADVEEISDSDNKKIIVKKLILNPNWENIQKERRETEFKSLFFETSLGWIRRKVTMKDGSIKDFLSDLLLPIKAGLELGQSVRIITYKLPDFSVQPNEDYMKSLQEIKLATSEFVNECLLQTVNDFGLDKGGNDGI